MAGVVRSYESMVILEPSFASEENVESFISKIKEVIEGAGGLFKEVDKWGMRTFAYPIKKKNEGYYFVFWFDGPPEVVDAYKKHMRYAEGLLRYMIVKVDIDKKQARKKRKRENKAQTVKG